jgi:hypothetical protein
MSKFRTQLEVLDIQKNGGVRFWVAGERDSIVIGKAEIPEPIRSTLAVGKILHAVADHQPGIVEFSNWEPD